MKPRIYLSNGMSGTYAWLIRELAHHPTRFSKENIEELYSQQPSINPRWRIVLLVRTLGSYQPLPDDVVNRLMRGGEFMIDRDTYRFDGITCRKKRRSR